MNRIERFASWKRLDGNYVRNSDVPYLALATSNVEYSHYRWNNYEKDYASQSVIPLIDHLVYATLLRVGKV